MGEHGLAHLFCKGCVAVDSDEDSLSVVSSKTSIWAPGRNFCGARQLQADDDGDALLGKGAPLERQALLEDAPRPRPGQVQVVQTTQRTGERLRVLVPLTWDTSPHDDEEAAVVLDASVQYQTFLGFGGSFTESSAELLLQMGPKNQERILNAYFNGRAGLNYHFGRVHINSCDFSCGNWSCLEQNGDADLSSFSLRRYEGAILPMIRRAFAIAGRPLRLIASPWSPPAWMKDTGEMIWGGRLLPEWRETWAKLFVRFAKEFQTLGLPLWAMTVQNEPQSTTAWENCLYSAEEERDFIRDFLGPALRTSGLDLKLLFWDHNRNDMFHRVQTICKDPEAAKYVWGVGYHWYGDPRYEEWAPPSGLVCHDNLQCVHDFRPSLHIIMTEACQDNGPHIGHWKLGERYAEAIIRDLNRWLEAWIDWNLILDTRGGPNHAENYVSAPILVDVAKDELLFLSSFFYIGHFSRYIHPGAKRILAAKNRDALEVTAFQNLDGTIVTVVLNQSDHPIRFSLRYNDLRALAKAPAHSITTFIHLTDASRSEARFAV